jgi:hypothetical protein
MAGEGGHHLAAGGGPDDDEAVLGGAGRHQTLARRQAGPAARPVPGQSAHLHSCIQGGIDQRHQTLNVVFTSVS